jgi:hypothetical protein
MQRSADDLFKELLASAVTPSLQKSGFRKKHLTFRRRVDEAVQVVNLQLSQGSTAGEKRFYVNVGVAFDAICRLIDAPIDENVKEHECSDRGVGDRLEKLIGNCPSVWVIKDDDDVSELKPLLNSLVQQMIEELDCISSISSYRRHRWFNRFRPAPINAQIQYLLGEFSEALQEVIALTQFFGDRPNASDADWWIESLRLIDLRAKCAETQ